MARLILIGLILLGQFAVLEAGLRMFGGMEAEPAFQSLFLTDERIGYRLRPGTSIRYTTTEFSNDLTINPQGVRDYEPIGRKANERRVLILGDSFVFAVQVPLGETFGEQLESRLNASHPSDRWRVINGGVQGYGPVEQWLFYRDVAAQFEPDVVLIVVSVANDAIEAFDAKRKLELGRVPDGTQIERGRTQFRRLVRSSMVLQLVRLRADQFKGRAFSATSERPLAGYLEEAPPFVREGLEAAARAFGNIAAKARKSGADVGFILMPARFQTHDQDFRQTSEIARRAGSQLLRHAATERFTNVLTPLGEPMLDLLPVFQAQQDRPGLYFVRNSHLSARGHRVAAEAILDFLQTSGLAAAATR
jgi:lysophospholipase L1-like esterase